MNIDVRSLKSGTETSISIKEDVIIDKELLNESEIIEAKSMTVEGSISRDYDGYYLDLNVKGTLVLPCSVTLKPLDYPIDAKIEGNSIELLEELSIFDKNDENTLDIFPIIWENILMEIPIRVVSEDAEVLTEGEGWKFISDSDNLSSSPFDKLNELL